MKTLACLSFTAALLTTLPASADESLAELQRRCSEQERQIERLELENSRLRGAQTVSEPVQKKVTPAQPEATTAETAAPKASPVHLVKQGDTLSRIARKHGTTTRELSKLNKLNDAGMIRIGQRLMLPSPVESTPAPAETTEPTMVQGTHKVKTGETFYSIARTYGLSIGSLSKANPEVNPRALRVGQELKLVAHRAPETTPTPEAHQEPTVRGPQTILNQPTTTVRRVETTELMTLQEFADLYSMDLSRLMRLNGISEPNFNGKTPLKVGSRLYVSAQPLD